MKIFGQEWRFLTRTACRSYKPCSMSRAPDAVAVLSHLAIGRLRGGHVADGRTRFELLDRDAGLVIRRSGRRSGGGEAVAAAAARHFAALHFALAHQPAQRGLRYSSLQRGRGSDFRRAAPRALRDDAHNGVARLSARCAHAARARPAPSARGLRLAPLASACGLRLAPLAVEGLKRQLELATLLPRGLRLGTALADLAQHTVKQLVGHARMLPPRPDGFPQRCWPPARRIAAARA